MKVENISRTLNSNIQTERFSNSNGFHLE